MCRVKITAYNLSGEAQNALGGRASADLDLPDGFSLRLSKDAQRLSTLSEILLEGALEFDVPATPTNNAVFSSFAHPNVFDSTVAPIKVKVEEGGYTFQFDRLAYRGRNPRTNDWQMELLRPEGHWADLAKAQKIADVDLGTMDVTLSSYQAIWGRPAYQDTTVPVWLPMVDYGDWADRTEPLLQPGTDPEGPELQPVKHIALEDFRPLFSIAEILKRCFCAFGWTLSGRLLELDYVRRLWAYILKEDFYNEGNGGSQKLVLRSEVTTIIGIIPNVVTYDPGSNAIAVGTAPPNPPGSYYLPAIVNKLYFRSLYKFCVRGYIVSTSGQSMTVELGIKEYDAGTGFGAYVDPETNVSFVLAASERKYVDLCITVPLDYNKGGVLDSLLKFTVDGNVVAPGLANWEQGLTVTIEPANRLFTTGDSIILKKCVDPAHLTLNMLKGFAHLFDARFDTDWSTKTVTVYPARTFTTNGETVAGWVNEGDIPKDLNAQLVCDSAIVTPVKKNAKRYALFKFRDSTDAHIGNLNLSEPPHSRTVFIGKDLPNETEEYANPFFEPSMDGEADNLRSPFNLLPSPTIPRFWDNDERKMSYKIAPRILYAFGTVEQRQIAGDNTTRSTYYFQEASTANIYYASQSALLPLSGSSAENSVVYGVREQDLYTLNYLAFKQQQLSGHRINALIKMTTAEYQTWDFRRRYHFNFLGRPLVCTSLAISDFAAGLEIPTPVEFYVPPATSSCCDLPCACRFKRCEYWQEIKSDTTQAALDTYDLTSFIVNDIQLVTSPVSLGLITTEEIGGRAFVLNFIRAMQGVGAEHFTFAASTRVNANRKDLHHFTIKRPECWSFKIEISDASGVLYRWTESLQEKRTSPGVYGPVGDPASLSVPENCITTTEY